MDKRRMIFRHSDGLDYVIEIIDGKVDVKELVDLPGANFKTTVKLDNVYDENAVWYAFVEDLAILSGKDVDEVIDFFTS